MSARRSPSLCSHNMQTQMYRPRVPHRCRGEGLRSQPAATTPGCLGLPGPPEQLRGLQPCWWNEAPSEPEWLLQGEGPRERRGAAFPSFVADLPCPTDTHKAPCHPALSGCPLCTCISVSGNRFHCGFATAFPQLRDQRCGVLSVISASTKHFS